jgi:NAD(P)-dependent dehydrogenase (short-subunit alcohol dehydrogenase family)
MDTIKSTLAQNFGGAAHNLAGTSQQFNIESDVPDLSGKVALITGGSEGIGYATAYTLLKHNVSRVFIISMREEVQSAAEESVRTHLGDTFADRITFFQADLSDLKAVTEIASKVSSQTDRLDILCLNAARGIMTYQTTPYIIDRHMAVNHIGHVTLTSHLLPVLKKTASDKSTTVRIQIQSSNAHQGSPKDTKFASIDEIQQDLGPNGQYGRSKLANLLYARYLARHLAKEHPNILANATHPGVVETKMSTEDIHEPYPKLGYAMDVGLKPFKKDIWEGCVSTVYAATTIKESGKYVCPPVAFEEGSELARDEELGEQLMKLTREIVKEKFRSESVDRGCPLKDY